MKSSYSKDQRYDAVAKVEEVGVVQASKELNIPIATLNTWNRKQKGKDETFVVVRLQRPWDVDLITLSMHPDFNLSYWAKESLRAWCKGNKDFVIPCPDKLSNKEIERINDEVKNGEKRAFEMSVRLDNEVDRDVVEKIGRLKMGYRNSFLKNLVRYYLSKPYFYFYGDAELFDDISERVVGETAAVPAGETETAPSIKSEQKDVPKPVKKVTKKPVTEKKEEIPVIREAVSEEIKEVPLPESPAAEEDDMDEATGFNLFGAIHAMED